MVLILGSALVSPGKKKTINYWNKYSSLGSAIGILVHLVCYAVKVNENVLFLKISYYLAPVTLLPYCSQNILHLWGFSTCYQPFSWHSLLLFLRFQLLSITSSEILFMNMLFILVSHSYPCFSVTKAYCLPSEYLPDLVWSPVPLECKQ